MATPRVLVIRGGAIGDFILTLPAIRLLREGIAGCHLEVLGYPGIADLAKTAGLADAVRSLGHREMAPLFAPGAPVSEAVADYLRSFDLVVSYLFDPDGFFRGNLERLGVKTLIECPHRVQPDGGPAAVQLARPLERLAFYLDDAAPQIRRELAAPEPSTTPCYLLHLGSGSEAKTWPAERWLQVLQALNHQHQHAVRLIFITGEAEAERGLTAALNQPDWAALKGESWHGLALPELAERLQTLVAAGGGRFLGHDSGISHLAAACGLPCLLLFGPTDPAVWAPQNAGVQVVRSPSEAMQDLPVTTVLAALDQA
jgi:ADP-heptose:LPS heptosyltransferase